MCVFLWDFCLLFFVGFCLFFVCYVVVVIFITSVILFCFVLLLLQHALLCPWCDGSLGRSLVMNSLRYFKFHNWCNKGHGMYYPVYWKVHIKNPLLLVRKGNP